MQASCRIRLLSPSRAAWRHKGPPVTVTTHNAVEIDPRT